jgi:hypothetical protein
LRELWYVDPQMRTLSYALLVAACGPHLPTMDAGSPDQACQAYASARCAKWQSCEPANVKADFADATTCVAREKEVCLNSISAPGTGNTPASMTACAAAYTNWSCPDWANSIVPEPCKIQPGSKAKGNPCIFSAQCASGYCSIPRGATCGACDDLPQVGTRCVAGNSCAGNGLYCDGVTGTCQAQVMTAGAFCDAGSCGYLLDCVAPLDGGAGTCMPLGTEVDAGCFGSQHDAPYCASQFGFVCLKNHCQQELFAFAGSACAYNSSTNSYTRCTAGSTCVAGDGGSTCVAAAAEGFACDTALGINCITPARCVATNGAATTGQIIGTCQLQSGVTCQ